MPVDLPYDEATAIAPDAYGDVRGAVVPPDLAVQLPAGVPPRTGYAVASGPAGTFAQVESPAAYVQRQRAMQQRASGADDESQREAAIRAISLMNAEQALNAAMQFQGMRQYHQLKAAGTPDAAIPADVWRRMFYTSAAAGAAALHTVQPKPALPPPTFGKTPTGQAYAVDARGGVHFEPDRSAATARTAAAARVGEQFTLKDGTQATWVGPNQIRLATKSGDTRDFTPSQLLQLAREADVSADPKQQQFSREITDFLLNRASQQIKGAKMGGATGSITPLPNTKAQLVVGIIYDTRRGAARWNGSAFEPVEVRGAK